MTDYLSKMAVRSERQSKTAAGVSRFISAILAKDGFPRSQYLGRGKVTDGFHIHRVGVSSTLSVYWRTAKGIAYETAQDKAMRKQHSEAILANLVGHGIVVMTTSGNGIYIDSSKQWRKS